MLVLLTLSALAGDLDDRLGRTQVEVRSAPYELFAGRSVDEMALPERLARLGYERVEGRPEAPGEYFWGRDRFWVYRQAHRALGRDHDPLLIGLTLDDGDVVTAIGADGEPIDFGRGVWLEPEVIAESFDGDRAIRGDVDLDALPDHVWLPLLALEDARFFQHKGVDGIAVARAALENAKAGHVVQGGSTITQQLIKNSDLTSKRSLDRKASEAVRALVLEANYSKADILEAYLDTVYYGHVDGLGIYGLDTAAHVFFSTDPADLTLDEAALLAAVVQGPNALSPIRHPEAARERRDRALDRMLDLEWATPAEIAYAKRRPVALDLSPPTRPLAHHFVRTVGDIAEDDASRRMDKGLGVAVDTTLDPWMQAKAEHAVATHLADLRRRYPRLRDAGLTAALVAVDADTGAVLAHVGGDPRAPDAFDRVTEAERQPGSAVKPLVLLEAFESCGLHPASRVSDAPYTLDLPTGPWSPANYDGRSHGEVDVRRALEDSLNVPFARIGQHCGVGAIGDRMHEAGLSIPVEPPPSLVLGALATTPIALAGAYTTFPNQGRASEPFAVVRIERPAGGALDRTRPKRHRVSSRAAAYLAGELMHGAVDHGTGRAADIGGLEVAGKTGTSSDLRDAWFAGYADGVVTVVWIGRDDDGSIGLTGGSAAAPLWKAFMADAVPARPPLETAPPFAVVTRYVDRDTGKLVGERHGELEVFRRGTLPPRDLPLLREEVPVVR